jgi:hypothetical protein
MAIFMRLISAASATVPTRKKINGWKYLRPFSYTLKFDSVPNSIAQNFYNLRQPFSCLHCEVSRDQVHPPFSAALSIAKSESFELAL